MASFLPDPVEYTLGALALVFIGLGVLARRFPDVPWLQHFDLGSRLTEEQRARLRRRANRSAGVELIALGFGIPLVYFALKMAFFQETRPIELAIVVAASLLCIGLGVAAFRSR